MVLSGIITAMVTPFNQRKEIDYQATEKLLNFLITKGVSGIFILGTNGEFQSLSQKEKISFAQFVIEKVDKRVPVIVGVGCNSTKESIELAKVMGELGADYLSVITPYFNKLKEEELYQHYYNLAQETKVPILLYNIPKITGNPLTPNLVKNLAREKMIVGIKDSSGDLSTIQAYIEETRDQDFFVLAGSDSLILKALKLGASGAVAATSNAIVENDLRIYTEFMAGNLEAAQEAQDSIEEFRRILKFTTIPAVLKYSMTFRGIDVGNPRRPVLPVPEEVKAEIQQVMAENYLKETEEK